MGRSERWGLPLLAKEMVELSGLRRTYLTRVLYAAVLVVASCFVLAFVMPSGLSTTAADSLGTGLPVVFWLNYLQRMGLYVILPVLASGVFTTEKERNTLGLLLLTRLGPWTIILEKFSSRLLLALSFQIISLPVMAFCYALGGVSLEFLLSVFVALLITSIKICSVCVMCSTYCRTSLMALLSSYALLYVMGVVLFALSLIISFGLTQSQDNFFESFARIPWTSYLYEQPPFFAFQESVVSAVAQRNSILRQTLFYSIPTISVSLLSLLLARRFLTSRAFAQPKQRLKWFFQALDRFFQRANQNRWTRGIVLTRTEHRDPDLDPVAWRERTTRSLGQPRYLIRLLLGLETPVLLMTSLATDPHALKDTAWMMLMGLWIILGLVTCVTAAGLIARERQQQTLDALLSTPLSGREIVEQKLAGLYRLIWILEVPMWTCLVLLAPIELEFVLNHGLMMLVYPRLIAWIAMWHGLRSKTLMAAVMQTLLDCTLRCIIPFMAVAMITWFLDEYLYLEMPGGPTIERAYGPILFLSPATLFLISDYSYEVENFYFHGLPVAGILNFAIQWVFLWKIRRKCLSRADALLCRRLGSVPSHILAKIRRRPDKKSALFVESPVVQ